MLWALTHAFLLPGKLFPWVSTCWATCLCICLKVIFLSEAFPITFFFNFNFWKIFLMWITFKVFTELVTTLFLFYVLGFSPWGMWDLSSPTRDWTATPFIGRQSLNHWTTREVPHILNQAHLSMHRNTHTLTFTHAHRHTLPSTLPTLFSHSIYHILSHAIIYSFYKCLSPYATLPACPEWNVNSMRAGIFVCFIHGCISRV